MSARAELTSAVFVRMAGFSFSRLEALRLSGAALAAARLSAAENTLSVLRAEAAAVTRAQKFDENPALADQHVRNRLLRQLRKITAFAEGAGSLEPALLDSVASLLPGAAPALASLREAIAARRSAEAEFQALFAAELEGSAQMLISAFADPRLREAVFIESANAYDGVNSLLSGGPRNSKRRQRERTAVAYLQRFAAKNDTNSICGPAALCFLDPAARETSIKLIRDIFRRRTYFSFWAAEELRLTFEQRLPPEERRFQRIPTARLTENKLQWCAIEHDATQQFKRSWRRAALPPVAAAVFRAAASPVSLASLLETLSFDPEEIEGAVEVLSEAGVLRDRPLLPTGIFDPLEELAREYSVVELRDSLAAAATTDLNGRVQAWRSLDQQFQTITGISAHRGEGAHYADRGLLHEDASAEVFLSLSASDQRRVRDGIDALVAVAVLPLDLARERVRAWFSARFGEGRVPALEVHRAFDRNQPYDRPVDTPRSSAIGSAIDAVRAELKRAFESSQGGTAHVSSQVLLELAARAGEARPGFASADLMLRSCAEGPRFVLGEVHGFFLLPTFWLEVMPAENQARAVSELRAAMARLAGGRPTLEALFLHTQATDRRVRIADRDLLIAGASREPCAVFGDLDMELSGGSLRFYLGDEEVVPVSPYTVYPFLTYTSPVAPLVDDFTGRFFPSALLPPILPSAETPRLVLDEEIVFRRRASSRLAGVLAAELAGPSEAERFLAGQRLRAALGGPRWFFVSIPGQPKPVLVDFENPFLLDVVARAVEEADPAAPIRFVEMLPAPSELSLLGPDGPRTFEIRAGILRAI